MSVHTQLPGSYRFGPFLVDAPAGQLHRGATKLRLAGQPFEILLMLLERRGQVVTREEIQERLWPKETFVDFENSLNKAINKLRQALSDSAEEPVYIETLPRRGYRFIGSLLPSSVSPPLPLSESVLEPASLAPPHPTESVASVRSSLLWRVAAVSVLLPIIAFVWLAVRALPSPRVLGAFPLTDSSRVDLYGGLHTDGVRLYFLLRRGAHWELAQMPVSGGEVQPISLPFPNARIHSVSPDGSRFALGPFETRRPSLPVWIMSSVGGVPKRLSDIVVHDAVFTRDGSHITYSTEEGIFEISLDGTATRKLIDIHGSKWSLAWSPDGSRLRFHWITPSNSPSRIWEVTADGKNLHQILPNWTEAEVTCCGRWTADGRYFFFLASSANSPTAIWVLREPRGMFHRQELPLHLSTGPVSASLLLPSWDGKRVYFLGNDSRAEYVRIDSQTHEAHGLLGGQGAASAIIAPGNNWIVYRGVGNALWRANLDGSARLQLTPSAMQGGLPAIRPDGKLIAFRGQPPGVSAARIYVVASEGGDPVEFASSSFPLESPAWSPDGKKLSYALDGDNDPSSGIYVADFSTKVTQKIPGSEKCWKHDWSPDGKYLACVTWDNDQLLLHDFAANKWTVAAQGKVFGPVLWARNSSGFSYQDILEEGEPVRRFDVKTHSSQRVFECATLLEGGVHRCGLESLAPDGSYVLRLTRGDHNVYALDVELP